MSTIWPRLLGAAFKQHYYKAGKYRTRALESGAGEPLILLHGTGGHAEAYIDNLLPHAEHFRTVAIDMLGHGYTDKPDGIEYTIDDYADHVVSVMDALGTQRASISGESLGAMVASWVAIKYPDRVNKIVLNTGILARPDPKGAEELEDLRSRSVAATDALSIESIRKRMEWLVLDPKSMPEEMIHIRHRIYSQPGVAARMKQILLKVLEMVLQPEGERYFDPANLQRIQCPTLVLWTRHNPGQSWELARSAAAHIPQSQFNIMEDCAHWPQFERPDEFNRIHIDFLLSSSASPQE
jgi:2-hydroxy-6-oxonona-2,4-dienedioate hydrolase